MLIVPFSNEPSRALATAMNSLRADRGNMERIWIFDDAERPDTEPMPSAALIERPSGLRFVTSFNTGRLMVYESSTQQYRPAKRKMILALDSNLFAYSPGIRTRFGGR
jgi:hypothetical protein